jgi:hypothetical protein
MIPTLGTSPLSHLMSPLSQNSEIIFREELSTAAEETLFCQKPAFEIMELTKGKGKVIEKRKMVQFAHNFGPYILMDLNHKKGQEQGVSSSIQKEKDISYPVD